MIGEAVAHLGVLLLRGIARLPYPVVRAIGEATGSLLYRLAAPRRRIALINLRLCFPDWSEERREQVAREHFRAFTRSFFDRFIVWYASAERIRDLVHLEDYDQLARHLGRPVILLAPHFVGLDAGGLRLQLETEAASMYAEQKSRVLNEAMTAGRSRFNGARMLRRTDGVRAAVRVIRDRVPFYFLPDMDLGPRDAVFVPFFGVPAATVTSVARLAGMTGAVIVPCVTRMTEDGYVARFHPAWEDFPGDDLEAATLRMNRFIEERVLEMPAQYLWTHKRFKTRPPGEPSPYAGTAD